MIRSKPYFCLAFDWRFFRERYWNEPADRVAQELDELTHSVRLLSASHPGVRVYTPDSMAFAIHVTSAFAVPEITVWNADGGLALVSIEATTFDAATFERIENAMRLFRQGLVACADCGELVPASSQARYFAGLYCEACWTGTRGRHAGNGGWRAVEARESYE